VSRDRIAVLGSGANGASIGADLTRAGLDVTLIDQWPEHVEAMRRDGVRVEMPHETQVTPVRAINLCDVATLRSQFDVVLVLMKAYDTRWACQLIEPYLADDALVAGVQNGMSADTVAEVVGPHRTLGAVIEITSAMYWPGIIERHSPPDRSWFAVGALHEAAKGREAQIADLLALSGSVEVVDDIRAVKWMKLVSNATTLVTTAIVDLPMVEAAGIPAMRDLMIRAGREALLAGHAQGYAVRPIFGLHDDDLESGEQLVDQLLDTLLAGFVLPHSRTTILQDWAKGRHSEVDDINGQVISNLAHRGIGAPVNSAVVDLAHRIERGELSPGEDNLDRLADLAGRDIVPATRFDRSPAPPMKEP
jgi:2-dehydropantoate 2-reductase